MNAVCRRVLLVLPLVIAAGCGVHEDKAVVKAAVDTSSKQQRHDSYEATAQLLDEKPELVDELYAVMRNHPKTMEAFLKDASGDLEQKWLAKAAGEYVAEHPPALEVVMGLSVPAIEQRPAARTAMNRALTTHAAQTADILTDDPQALAAMVKALLLVTEKKPAARKNLVKAVHEDRQAIVALVKEDKELTKAIAGDLLKEMIKDKPALEKALAATGAFDVATDLKAKE